MSSLSASEVARLFAVVQHGAARLRERLPITPEQLDDDARLSSELERDPSVVRKLLADLPPAEPQIHYRSLASDEEWDLFDQGMRYAFDSTAPWHRIVTVLRGHGVTSAIIEENYICLDYRSEQAAFYSQLNSPTSPWSPRIHFFSQALDSRMPTFSEELIEAYKGYVVCRPGHLPLIGRALIKTPGYIDECAEVEEVVHLLGHSLTVRGVPFMQQDERFAVCAQVAAWTTHYSAFRRGLVERRLIADFVVQEGDARPMRPQVTSGQLPSQVADRLSKFGLRTLSYITPLTEAYDYPRVPSGLVPSADEKIGRVLELLAILDIQRHDAEYDQEESGGPAADYPATDNKEWREDITEFVDGVYLLAYELAAQGTTVADELMDLVEELHTSIFDLLTLPFIRSRWPVYCDTRDHAMVLCGRSSGASGVVHFYHDDQFGPYLASRQGIAVSKNAFMYQSYVVDGPGISAPKEDRAFGEIQGQNSQLSDRGREIHHLLVAQPARCLLDPMAALNSAFFLAEDIRDAAEEDWIFATSVVMGLDYKQDRLSKLSLDDVEGSEFFASTALAEWIVVIEAINEAGVVVWECVYDGSSGANYPNMQILRFGRDVLAFDARPNVPISQLTLRSEHFSPLEVPFRVGKVR